MSDPAMSEETPPRCPVVTGDVIDGKYRIDKPLAYGGMGVVCAATHVELETPVALKLVRAELASNPDATRRFLNEAKAAACLKGEHVARVIDFGTLPSGAPYMVMEYLHGCDLWSAIANQGPLPIVMAVDYVLQACEALAEAHALRIVHRDIKPENLFLAQMPDGSSSIKVLDFGISKLPRADDRKLTNPNNGLGSPYYMSPEQMCAPSDVDPRSDIWSVGCVLYVLLAGQLPFYHESVAGVCAKVLSETPIPLRSLRPEVPDEIEAIIARCLEKERNGRYEDVAELVRALAPFASVEAQHCVTRVQRILARSSDPPREDAEAARALAHLPTEPALPSPFPAAPKPSFPPVSARDPAPELVAVIERVQTPIPVMPLVRRRVSRPTRPNKSGALRSAVLMVLATLTGGAAIITAQALGYDLSPSIHQIVQRYLPTSAAPPRASNENSTLSAATPASAAVEAPAGRAADARAAADTIRPGARPAAASSAATTPAPRPVRMRALRAKKPGAASDPNAGLQGRAAPREAARDSLRENDFRAYLSALRPSDPAPAQDVPEEYADDIRQ